MIRINDWGHLNQIILDSDVENIQGKISQHWGVLKMNQGNFIIALSCRVASEQLSRDFKLNDDSYDLNLWPHVTKQWGKFFPTKD